MSPESGDRHREPNCRNSRGRSEDHKFVEPPGGSLIFQLHRALTDMYSYFDDPASEGKADKERRKQRVMRSSLVDTAPMIRTAPLWGLRRRPQLMHDGLSLTVRDAIKRHGGQAQKAGETTAA